MSVIPFTTQLGVQDSTQNSQLSLKIVLVYSERMTERQSAAMKECQDYLYQNLGIVIRQANDLETLPRKMKFFVIPNQKYDLIKKIRAHFEKPLIYLPRTVIEARGYYKVNLPARHLAISLTMHNCNIFLVKSCDLPDLRNEINEMCGRVVNSFSGSDFNVVITDTADNKYCAKAFKKNIPVVSRSWVDENYNIASEEESSFFNHDATSTLKDHQIKPFYGLFFKITVKSLVPEIKQLITENQGHIIYGNEKCLTHIVVPSTQDISEKDLNDSFGYSTRKPKVVDIAFLKQCVTSGYYLSKREYRDVKSSYQISVSEKQHSQVNSPEENNTPPLNGFCFKDENQANMLPPLQTPRPLRQQQQQPDNIMDDMIRKAMSTFETAQTQQASTQMRRLPDPELRIEQTFEPSQQLYWTDKRA